MKMKISHKALIIAIAYGMAITVTILGFVLGWWPALAAHAG